MSTLDHDCLDAETILNDLCASKINASISWIGDGGFHFVLGDPPQADGWAFSTIGAAAISLRDEACAYSRTATSRGNMADSSTRHCQLSGPRAPCFGDVIGVLGGGRMEISPL